MVKLNCINQKALQFYQILCFSMSKYLNAYMFLFILAVALWNIFPPQKFCVVYFNLTANQMKA